MINKIKMEMTNKETQFCFAIINNIPPGYHSRDLRNYFSQFIESKGFVCFHFRHRPEAIASLDTARPDIGQTSGKRSTCCVVKLATKKLTEFIKMYNKKHWVGTNGDVMRQACYIFKIRLPTEQEEPKLLTRGEQKQVPADRELFTENDLQRLPELNPPDIMPNGNVGTPTMVFMEYIKQCRLPPSIIKKLGLSFPKTRTNKQYGSVPFDYGGDILTNSECEISDTEVLTASGHGLVSERLTGYDNASIRDSNEIKDKSESLSESVGGKKSKRKSKKRSWRDEEAKSRLNLNIEEKMIGQDQESEEDNDSCEEWERHEALYDDVSNQERNKERLFEEEIELKWEKGGSGLVFYTDAQYWQAQEGDFDEQTVDDWDVDMSGYYEEGAGDKDAQDYLTIRQETRRRHGIENTDRFSAGIASKRKHKKETEIRDTKIGKFEAHTKGIGRKILETQGWSDGQGLGSTITGMVDALDNEGQRPRDRKGFGYHGEKLNRNPGRAQRKVIISTIFDNPSDTDPVEPLKRSHEPYHLKYRDEVKFDRSAEKLDPNISKFIK